MFTLTFVEPSGRREQVPLADEERGLVVGRGQDADLVLDSKEVSRRHARFFVRDGALFVEDLGSHNGVYIDGNKAEGPAELRGAPKIELGDVTCSFTGSASKARVAAGASGGKAASGAVRKPAVRASAKTAAAAPEIAPAVGSARAGALAARARAASQEQAKGGAATKPARPAFTARVASAPEPQRDSGVTGLGAGAALRSLGKGGSQITLPAKATVGRGADCDLVLDDDSVSRHHAELFRDERGLYRLRDLGSANGTFIDGRAAEDGELVPEGARLRFGDVELLFWKPPPANAAATRQKTMLLLLVVIIAGFVAAYWLKQKKLAERAAQEAAAVISPEDEARGFTEQAQAALESDRFDEAARVAQAAIDKDPIAAAPRKILAQARREQAASKTFSDAQSKASIGNEDEALRLFAQIDPQSRFFARARIKAKSLAQDLMRTHGKACAAAASGEHWEDAASQCGAALDVKCQLQSVDNDLWFKSLRRAEKALSRRVAWSCPPALAPLFRDSAGGSAESAGDATSSDRAMKQLYPDDKIREAIGFYARGDIDRALRSLSDPAMARGRSAQLAADASEKIRLVDGRFREGQTAMLRNDLSRVDEIWGDALKADALLVPAGVESSRGGQMRSALSQAHAKLGDEKFSKGQYATAFDEWSRGLAVNPKDPHLLDSLAQLEKVAEGLLSNSPTCDQIQVAAHITRADPPSQAHASALEASARCK